MVQNIIIGFNVITN